MLNVSGVNSVQYPVVSFKANNPYAGMPMDRQQQDMLMLSEKQSKQEKRQKWSTIGSVVLAGAFATMALVALKKMKPELNMIKAQEEAAKKQAKYFESGSGGANDQMEALTGVKLEFRDCKGSNKVADLESDTTNPVLAENFMNLVKQDRLIPESKAWSGTEMDAANCVYLYGYGGTGKTYVAEQYAQKIGAMFTSIKYPDLGSPYKDAASMKVNAFFNKLVEYAKANPDRKIVVCIDECDALIKKVIEGSHGAEEAAKTRAAVLTGIDKTYAEANNVTIIMTSNYHPESGLIDDVVKRRLNNCIEVPLPQKKQADAMTKLGLKNVKAISDDFYNTPEYNDFIVNLVKEGYSNGEIAKICEEARKSFAATLEGVPKEELTIEKHPFLVDYLKKGQALKGQAASKTNTSMKISA